MIDLLLDEKGDLALEGGDLRFVNGAPEIGQGLEIGLRSVRGEYILDRRRGLDLFGRVLGRRDPAIRDAEIKREILARPGVAELVSYKAEQDDKSRELFVSFEARAEDGTPLVSTAERIFIPAPAPAPPAEPEADPLELVLAPRPVFTAAGTISNTAPYSQQDAHTSASRGSYLAPAGARPVQATEDI